MEVLAQLLTQSQGNLSTLLNNLDLYKCTLASLIP